MDKYPFIQMNDKTQLWKLVGIGVCVFLILIGFGGCELLSSIAGKYQAETLKIHTFLGK